MNSSYFDGKHSNCSIKNLTGSAISDPPNVVSNLFFQLDTHAEMSGLNSRSLLYFTAIRSCLSLYTLSKFGGLRVSITERFEALNSIVSTSGKSLKNVVILASSHEITFFIGTEIRSIGPFKRFIRKATSFGRLIIGVPERATTLQLLAL